MPNINFELKSEGLKLKLDGKINSSILKELNKIVNYNKIDRKFAKGTEATLEEENNEFYDIEYKFRDVSRILRKDKGFQKLAVKLYEEYKEHYTESIKISNILEVTYKNNKIKKEFKLNEDELRKKCEDIFKNIDKNKIDFLIICISGIKNEESVNFIVDLIIKDMFNIPKRMIKSKNQSTKTLIEVVFFGDRLKKNKFDFDEDFW